MFHLNHLLVIKKNREWQKNDKFFLPVNFSWRVKSQKDFRRHIMYTYGDVTWAS